MPQADCGGDARSRRLSSAHARGCNDRARVRESAGPAVRVERLVRAEGDSDLVVHGARGTDRIAMRPSLFAELHRPFALGAGERLAARCLLALLRLPGGTRLLRAWHARRGA
jgi:hypothetical protein